MTEEAWLRIKPKLFEGYRSIPYAKDNHQWYVMGIFDGFGSHCMNHTALDMRLEANIVSIKEEGGVLFCLSSIRQGSCEDQKKSTTP